MDRSSARQLERKMARTYGVEIRIHINPHPDVVELFRRINYQSSKMFHISDAEEAAKKNSLRLASFDMSKPGEPRFSDKAYAWGDSIDLRKNSECTDSDLEILIESRCKHFIENAMKAEEYLRGTCLAPPK